MTSNNPSHPEPTAPKESVAVNCFQRVLRATRMEPASRTKGGRDEPLVSPNHARPKAPWPLERKHRNRAIKGRRPTGPAVPAEHRSSSHMPHDALARPHPRPDRQIGTSMQSLGAKFPEAGAANDCGPPHWTGIWVRSFRVLRGPPHLETTKRRGAIAVVASPGPSPAEARPVG